MPEPLRMAKNNKIAPGKLIKSPYLEAATGIERTQNRLVVFDRNFRIRFLVDTGADISVLPKHMAKKKSTRINFMIYAANGSAIPTYGEVNIKLNLSLRREFDWNFLIA